MSPEPDLSQEWIDMARRVSRLPRMAQATMWLMLFTFEDAAATAAAKAAEEKRP